MTRKQQMQDMMTAAFWRDIEEGNQPDHADAIEIAKTYERAYQQGWKDADSYPNWIPVEERLPEPHFSNTSSKWVLVSIKGSVFIDSYNHKHKEWRNNGTSVTHWMEIVPPQGNDDKK